MPERTIGEILIENGRLSEDEVAVALEYQRENGGYFGEALLAKGFVSEEELEWSLASQYDLPYVFPEADSLDPEATAMVSPEWALANLALPIMKTSEALTVVVDSPIKTEAIDHLRARTDLRVDLALASTSRIRELIRRVYARPQEELEEDRPSPVSVSDFFRLALEATSRRFGISNRRHRAWAWYEDAGRIRRRPLEGMWHSELAELVSPSPDEEGATEKARHAWTAQVNRQGMVTPVEVRYMADESGAEYLFRPVAERAELEERFSTPPPGILSEIRLLARSGTARFIVITEPDELGHEILPHLPTLILDPSWRSIYVTDREHGVSDEAFSVEMPDDPATWEEELDGLRAFHFDVVTVDLSTPPGEWASSTLDVAAVAFLLWEDPEDRRVAQEAGVRWELRIVREEGDRLEWTLEPLHP